MEESKKNRPEYGFNPLSRRWVKKNSDAYLRLIKAGIVHEDPEVLDKLTADRREATRRRLEMLAQSRAEALVAAAAARGFDQKREPRAPSPEPPKWAKLRGPNKNIEPRAIVVDAIREKLRRLVEEHDLAECKSERSLSQRLLALALDGESEDDADSSVE